jgi:hypothetical protein
MIPKGNRLRIAPLLLLGALFCLCFPGLAGAVTVFSDQTFNNGDWTATVVLDQNGSGSFTAYQVSSGGNPGSYREISEQTSQPGPEQFAVAHFKSGANYDPSASGFIATIDFSIDGNCLVGGTSGAFGFGAVIRQGGVNFYGPYFTPLVGTGWQPLVANGLTASNFTSWSGSPVNPDFSGGPMQFGYVTGQGTAGYDLIQGVGGADNWNFTIHPIEGTPTKTTTWGSIKADLR